MPNNIEALWAHRTHLNTPLVSVQWADIREVSRWNDDTEEVRPARKLHQAGFLLYEGIDPGDPGEEIVVLGQVYDEEEGTWHGLTSIPKRAYRKVDGR